MAVIPIPSIWVSKKVEPGNIIVRQRGTRFHPGNYVSMGKDHTLFCLKEGHVRFEHNKLTGRKWVHADLMAGHLLHPVYARGSTTAADLDAQLTMQLLMLFPRTVPSCAYHHHHQVPLITQCNLFQ
uniref:Ribosomal protein L27 n=1 Tax=Setaria viridis TaxID=4556 RepID=A0A4U6WHK4_SETVI|nr:hypothetical protein SEVIR_1G369401v2 [Setaria viridis]